MEYLTMSNFQPPLAPLKDQHKPHRLVCIQIMCPYTGCGHLQEEIGLESITYLFGLRCCEKHRKVARRDCAAWMRQYGRLQISEKFMKEMNLVNKEFLVTRSNGNIDNDWIINITPDTFNRAELVQMTDGKWGIKMFCPRETASKTVPLKELGLEWLFDYIERLPEDEYII